MGRRDILDNKWTMSSWIACVVCRKIGKWKDLRDSVKGQISDGYD